MKVLKVLHKTLKNYFFDKDSNHPDPVLHIGPQYVIDKTEHSLIVYGLPAV